MLIRCWGFSLKILLRININQKVLSFRSIASFTDISHCRFVNIHLVSSPQRLGFGLQESCPVHEPRPLSVVFKRCLPMLELQILYLSNLLLNLSFNMIIWTCQCIIHRLLHLLLINLKVIPFYHWNWRLSVSCFFKELHWSQLSIAQWIYVSWLFLPWNILTFIFKENYGKLNLII